MEQVQEDHCSWLARARGYKVMDEYAKVRGYEEQNYGHAILQVINPKAKSGKALPLALLMLKLELIF